MKPLHHCYSNRLYVTKVDRKITILAYDAALITFFKFYLQFTVIDVQITLSLSLSLALIAF